MEALSCEWEGERTPKAGGGQLGATRFCTGETHGGYGIVADCARHFGAIVPAKGEGRLARRHGEGHAKDLLRPDVLVSHGDGDRGLSRGGERAPCEAHETAGMETCRSAHRSERREVGECARVRVEIGNSRREGSRRDDALIRDRQPANLHCVLDEGAADAKSELIGPASWDQESRLTPLKSSHRQRWSRSSCW